jgi:hypothetical protein
MKKRAMKSVGDEAGVDVSAYRRLALVMPGAVESSHMGAPAFSDQREDLCDASVQAEGAGHVDAACGTAGDVCCGGAGVFLCRCGRLGTDGNDAGAGGCTGGRACRRVVEAFHQVLAKQAVKKSVGKKRVTAKKKV